MTIDNYKFAGKKAIVRVDFNVPLNEEGKITDDTRIRGALPTLKKVLADGGALIIMSHLGGTMATGEERAPSPASGGPTLGALSTSHVSCTPVPHTGWWGPGCTPAQRIPRRVSRWALLTPALTPLPSC